MLTPTDHEELGADKAGDPTTAGNNGNGVAATKRRVSAVRMALAAAAVLVVAVGAVVVVLVVGSRGGSPKVVVATASPAVINAQPGGTGYTSATPAAAFSVALYLSGVTTPIKITNVFVTEGSSVRVGDPLLGLDAAPIRAEESQIKLELAQAKATLQAAERGVQSATTEAQRASLAIRAQTEQGQVAVDAELLNVAVGNTTSITAPVSGSVTGVTVAAGQTIKPGQTTMQIIDSTAIQVDTGVTLQDLQTIKVGDPASLTFSALPGVSLVAKVVSISPIATANGLQGTVVVRAVNSSHSVVPIGTQAFVQVSATHSAAVTVPRVAVVNLDLDPSVYVLRQGRVYRLQVAVGAYDDRRVEIMSGLRSGDAVVLTGTQTLKDGQTVRSER